MPLPPRPWLDPVSCGSGTGRHATTLRAETVRAPRRIWSKTPRRRRQRERAPSARQEEDPPPVPDSPPPPRNPRPRPRPRRLLRRETPKSPQSTPASHGPRNTGAPDATPPAPANPPDAQEGPAPVASCVGPASCVPAATSNRRVALVAPPAASAAPVPRAAALRDRKRARDDDRTARRRAAAERGRRFREPLVRGDRRSPGARDGGRGGPVDGSEEDADASAASASKKPPSYAYDVPRRPRRAGSSPCHRERSRRPRTPPGRRGGGAPRVAPLRLRRRLPSRGSSPARASVALCSNRQARGRRGKAQRPAGPLAPSWASSAGCPARDSEVKREAVVAKTLRVQNARPSGGRGACRPAPRLGADSAVRNPNGSFRAVVVPRGARQLRRVRPREGGAGAAPGHPLSRLVERGAPASATSRSGASAASLNRAAPWPRRPPRALHAQDARRARHRRAARLRVHAQPRRRRAASARRVVRAPSSPATRPKARTKRRGFGSSARAALATIDEARSGDFRGGLLDTHARIIQNAFSRALTRSILYSILG